MTLSLPCPQPAEGGGDHLVQADGPEEDVDRPDLNPAGVEEPPHQPVQPLGLLEDRPEEGRSLIRGPVDTGLEQTGHRGLDGRQWSPQVVGHRPQRAVRRRSVSAIASAEPASRSRSSRSNAWTIWAAKALKDGTIVSRQLPVEDHQHAHPRSDR